MLRNVDYRYFDKARQIANISDWKFDEERRKDSENRDNNKNYKKGTN